ncbi:hypothetical protein ACROYT_G007856 [Oculina patagonica]
MCTEGSTSCLGANFTNGSTAVVYSTATKPKSLYERRCSLNRTDWKFADYDLYDGPHLTIVNQFDLVCGRAFQAWLANSMLFFGWAVGAIVLGIISDKFGRRKVLFPSLVTVVIVAFAMAFAKAYWIVAVCRFVIGFCEAGCFITMFVLATELVGPEKRALAGTLVWIYFTVALLVLAIKAYFVRNWKILLILSSAPFAFIVAFWKLIPESVRWLLVNGRKDEARAILEKVAVINKKEMPKDELYVPVQSSRKSVVELFKSWKLAKLSLIQCYAWFVNGMVYYGLSLSAGEFGGSIYLNFVLTSLVEVPANILVIHNCNRFGRRKTVVVHMIAAAISAVCVSFIPAGTDNKGYIGGRVTLGTLGKLFITTSFNAIYVFSAELFPTVVRNSGMGMVSVASRIGAASSPFVVQMTRINPILPFALMGGLSFIAAVFCWILPETVGKRTAEVMGDSDEKEQDLDNQLTMAFNAETGSMHFYQDEPEQMDKMDEPLTT